MIMICNKCGTSNKLSTIFCETKLLNGKSINCTKCEHKLLNAKVFVENLCTYFLVCFLMFIPIVLISAMTLALNTIVGMICTVTMIFIISRKEMLRIMKKGAFLFIVFIYYNMELNLYTASTVIILGFIVASIFYWSIIIQENAN